VSASAAGEQGRLNVLCEGYRSSLSHVDAPRRFMAAAIRAKRPPSDIMQTLHTGKSED